MGKGTFDERGSYRLRLLISYVELFELIDFCSMGCTQNLGQLDLASCRYIQDKFTRLLDEFVGESILTDADDNERWIFGNEHGCCSHGIPFFRRSGTQQGNGTRESSAAHIFFLTSHDGPPIFLSRHPMSILDNPCRQSSPSGKKVVIDGEEVQDLSYGLINHLFDRFWLVIKSGRRGHDNASHSRHLEHQFKM